MCIPTVPENVLYNCFFFFNPGFKESEHLVVVSL